jgi:3-deoxy-D-manno-octulosonic-acid transferase
MKIAYTVYKYVSGVLFMALFPLYRLYARLKNQDRDDLRQRLGMYAQHLHRVTAGTPQIWIHAVSVGEVSAASSVVEALRRQMPRCRIIFSTTTAHGYAAARQKLGHRVTLIFAPFDFILAVRRALRTFRPDVFVCLETELWPNWLVEAHRAGIRTALVNGRISVRSIKGYLRIKPLMQFTLAHVDAFSMICEADARRVELLGAPAQRVFVNGNAKYDALPFRPDRRAVEALRQQYGLSASEPVFLAGSTRHDEEAIILDAYEQVRKQLPELLLVIAPRHVERAPQIKRLIDTYGLPCQLRTELLQLGNARTAPVVIMDTMGELEITYGIASIVFCGGSLVPLGGQNILEAAAWGKPVLYGPSMDDFLEAQTLLENAQAGIQVQDGADLAVQVEYFLTHPHQAEAIGLRAQAAVRSTFGAATKHAAVIQNLTQGEQVQAWGR